MPTVTEGFPAVALQFSTLESSDEGLWTFYGGDITFLMLTSVDVCNVGGVSGDGFQLWLDVLGTQTVWHQGRRGDGFDTFPWRGDKLIVNSATIGMTVYAGQWDLTLCGFYVPAHALKVMI